jgi:hypothetical protein
MAAPNAMAVITFMVFISRIIKLLLRPSEHPGSCLLGVRVLSLSASGE